MTFSDQSKGESTSFGDRETFLGVAFDRLTQAEVLDLLRKRRVTDEFAYIVTPNVDHVVRLAGQPEMLDVYRKAWLCLCDSKPIQVLSRTVRRPLTHVTGSDLTKAIFADVLEAGDVVTMVVAHKGIAQKLAAQYPAVVFHSHVPPFGILAKPEALQDVINFVVDHPARFVFVAIGSPQSEAIVTRVKKDERARGTALCIGASLEFITGDRTRAPAWMNRSGMEWMHRVAKEPSRLWKRYLFSVPPLLRLYWQELRKPRP